MLFTATMLVRSYRDALTLSTGWRNTCLLVTTFTFLLFLIIERVKIISPAIGAKLSTTFKRNKLPFQRFPPITSPQSLFKRKMKFTSIIFVLAAILGSAATAAAGSEQNTAVVNALRAKLAEREVSTKTASEAMMGKVRS